MKNKILILMPLLFVILITNFAEKNIDFKPTNKKIIWGVIGHTLTSNDYKVFSLDKQLELIKKEKFNYYRLDVLTDGNGKITLGNELLVDFLKKWKENNVKILPSFYPSSLDYNDSEQVCYSKGYIMGKGFTELYGQFFPIIEISNESELKVAIKDSEGKFVMKNNVLQYDPQKLKRILQFLKGANDGIKKANPKIKTLIGISGHNTSFLKMLLDYKINFDIVGTNWYDVNLYNKSEYNEVLKTIKREIRKPIWVTELNYREGSTNVSPEAQAHWLKNTIDNLTKSKLVDAIFIYQLLDENGNLDRPGVPPFEANFGIYKVEGDKVTRKFK